MRRRVPRARRIAELRQRARSVTPDEYCQQKAAQSGSSFYYSFLFLPPRAPPRDHRALRLLPRGRRRRRRGARPGDRADQARVVAAGDRARSSTARRSIRSRRRCVPVVREFALPQEHFQTVIDGMAMDLDATRYLDFAALELYCHRVAGVVGLHVGGDLRLRGSRDAAATRATSASRSSSPTSCRDVGEDARRGRIYLPQDDLARFGVTRLVAAARASTRDAFRDARCAFEVDRARGVVRRARSAQLPAERPQGAARRASSWRRSTGRCSTKSPATVTCVLDRRTSLTPRCASCGSRGRRRGTSCSSSARRVIGGGWAGLRGGRHAAPARRRIRGTCSYETAPVLGGRAPPRRARRPARLDNGQHLLLGAYTRTLELMTRVHGERARARSSRGVRCRSCPFGASASDGGLTMLARRAPGRLGLLVGLLSARGLARGASASPTIVLVSQPRAQPDLRVPRTKTVAKMLSPLPPRVARLLWEPLCVAALNTPVATRVRAGCSRNVLRAALRAPATRATS